MSKLKVCTGCITASCKGLPPPFSYCARFDDGKKSAEVAAAVAAEREACAKMLKEKAETYRAQVATAPTAHYRSLVSGQAYVLDVEAERIRARGKEPKP